MTLDYLYQDTITFFSRCIKNDSIIWIPHILRNVHCWGSDGTRTGTNGDAATDNVSVNIRYLGSSDRPDIGGLIYLKPKEFQRLAVDEAKKYITFSSGDTFDFFMIGNCGEFTGSINDDEYMHKGGFFNYVNSRYDDVYAVTSCAKSRFLPHFTITGR